MKFYYILMSILIIQSCSFAQMPRTLQKAEYIFEGEVIDTMYYNGTDGRTDNLFDEYDENGKRIPLLPLTAVKIQIKSIIRGNINQETIELVDNIGGYWSNGIFMHILKGNRSKPICPGTKGVFFCTESPYKPSPMQTDNEIRLVPVEIVGFFLDGSDDLYGFGKTFYSKKEFYDFLSKYPNITIPKEFENKENDSKSNQGKVQDNIEKKEE